MINKPPRRFPPAPRATWSTPRNASAFLAICAALAVALGAPAASGQDPALPDAATVVAEVQARYDAIPSLRARFEQRYVHRLHDSEARWRGRIAVRRPSKLRIDYDDPRGRVVVSDGTTLVSYDPDPPPGQYYEQSVDDDALPLALAMLGGGGRIADLMEARVIDASAIGFAGTVLELRPLSPVPTIDRVLLYVDRSDARRGRVHRVLIVDPAGNTNRLDLLEQDERARLPDSFFSFRPPSAAHRVVP